MPKADIGHRNRRFACGGFARRNTIMFRIDREALDTNGIDRRAPIITT